MSNLEMALSDKIKETLRINGDVFHIGMQNKVRTEESSTNIVTSNHRRVRERLPIHEVVQPRELRSGASNDAITQPQWRNAQQIVVCRNSKISNCPQEKLGK